MYVVHTFVHKCCTTSMLLCVCVTLGGCAGRWCMCGHPCHSGERGVCVCAYVHLYVLCACVCVCVSECVYVQHMHACTVKYSEGDACQYEAPSAVTYCSYVQYVVQPLQNVHCNFIPMLPSSVTSEAVTGHLAPSSTLYVRTYIPCHTACIHCMHSCGLHAATGSSATTHVAFSYVHGHLQVVQCVLLL